MIIIVALFKKKNDIFFQAVKAADSIPGDLLMLSRGEIAAFQRLRNDTALQPAPRPTDPGSSTALRC